MKKKIKVYIGCALTHAPDEFKKNISLLKDQLRQEYEVLDFLGQSTKFTPQQVFEYDIHCIRTCDVFIANVTHPSLGLGVEFGTAIERKKPIITIAETDAVVSRFIFGYVHPNHYVFRYSSIDEAITFILEKLQQISPDKSALTS